MFTMTAVTCLLVFIVLAINSLNWMMLERQSDTVLETIVDSDGTFHKMDFDRPPPFSRPLDMDRMRASRFFIVRSDLSGNIIDVNIDQISAIDHETAKSYALEVLKTDDTFGRVHGYKFAVKQLGPNTLTFFMDTSEQSENFRMVLFASTAIAVLCWMILLLIVILLSGKVIRPVLVGMEKQKQFIGNASHELQTPLAVCQNRLEMLMEDETLGEEQMGEIVKTYQTLEYVSKLNKSLLLLSKIDNSMYADSKEVNLNEVLHRYVEDYQEVYHYRSITLDVQEQGAFRVWMNETLAVVLITNLLKNAFVHNIDEGNIRIEVSSSSIRFGNSASGLALDGTRIFERFYQGSKKKEGSTGLGLAIVDAICRQCGLQIRYRFAQDMHWFELSH